MRPPGLEAWAHQPVIDHRIAEGMAPGPDGIWGHLAAIDHGHRARCRNRNPSPKPRSRSRSEIGIPNRIPASHPGPIRRCKTNFRCGPIGPKPIAGTDPGPEVQMTREGPDRKCVHWRPMADRPSGPRPLADGRSARGRRSRSHRLPATKIHRCARVSPGENGGAARVIDRRSRLQLPHLPATLGAAPVAGAAIDRPAIGQRNQGQGPIQAPTPPSDDFHWGQAGKPSIRTRFPPLGENAGGPRAIDHQPIDDGQHPHRCGRPSIRPRGRTNSGRSTI